MHILKYIFIFIISVQARRIKVVRPNNQPSRLGCPRSTKDRNRKKIHFYGYEHVMNFDFQYVISADFLVLRLFIFYRGHPTQDYATTYGDNVTAIIFESTDRDRLDIPDMDDFVSTQNT